MVRFHPTRISFWHRANVGRATLRIKSCGIVRDAKKIKRVALDANAIVGAKFILKNLFDNH